MTDNLKYYNVLRQPPREALRAIQGGRLSGKTDINPQWRIEAMTATFGACGTGWKYEIVSLWTEPGTEGQIFAFASVNIYFKEDGEWSAAIPGIGGNMLIEQERSGLHLNDEAYKMAVTDALSVAMKALGVAGDVYAGLFDGSKYVTSKPSAEPTKTETAGQREHWCKEHNTAFFMRGKMKSFAHPIKNADGTDSGEWCHEHVNDKPETKQEPEDLFPEDAVKPTAQTVNSTASKTPAEPLQDAAGDKTSGVKAQQTVVIPNGMKTLTDMQKIIFKDIGMQPVDQLKELGYSRWADVTETPAECYTRLMAAYYERKEG